MKDWKLIFNTNNYYYIIIEEMIKENYLKFYWQYKDEIEKTESFFFIMPTKEDIESNNHTNYVNRFAPLIKEFMENEGKKTLFIEEDILKAIVKEDKLINFFRYISKKNKNVVLFSYSNMKKYTYSSEYSSLTMTENELALQYNLLDRFESIKSAIDKTYNPFKDPINAFNKIQADD